MRTTNKQRLFIAFSSVLVGCVVGATMPRLAAQSFPPNPTAPRWEQFCERLEYERYGAVANARLRSRGEEGFELVSADFDQPDLTTRLCFKRPTPQ